MDNQGRQDSYALSLIETPIESFLNHSWVKQLICRANRRRARVFVSQFKAHLSQQERILDLGAGSCTICELLMQSGIRVTPLDVKNSSFVEAVSPMLYDGRSIPFPDNWFDIALILTVLHHTPDPGKVICEARRVSRKLIIIEDIYSSMIRKRLTFLGDSLGNLEFRGHPHSNKTDAGWQSLFRDLGLVLKDVRYFSYLPIFQHAVYYLEK